MNIKILSLSIMLAFLGFACTNENHSETTETTTEEVTEEVTEEAAEEMPMNEAGGWGEVITAEGAVDVATALANMGDAAEYNTKVVSTVTACCQKKGCWMHLDKGDGEEMRVTFKDYGFFVPKDIPGQKVVVEGVMRTDTTTVEMLKHYAEDAGKSQEEIDAISEPEIDIAFEAIGVIALKE